MHLYSTMTVWTVRQLSCCQPVLKHLPHATVVIPVHTIPIFFMNVCFDWSHGWNIHLTAQAMSVNTALKIV